MRIIIAVLLCCVGILLGGVQAQTENPDPDLPLEEAQVITAISNLYSETYARVIQERDIGGLYDLFITDDIPLCVTTKTANGPHANCESSSDWINVFSTWSDTDYEVHLSTPRIDFIDGGAVSIAGFDEQFNGVSTAFGTDVFLYVRTEVGWRLALMNVVNSETGQSLSIGETMLFEPSPGDVVELVEDSFNAGDIDTLSVLFAEDAGLVLNVNQIDNPDFSFAQSRGVAGLQRFRQAGQNVTLQIRWAWVEVYDQYIASAFAHYHVEVDGERVEEGETLWTLLASMQNGWQVTSVIISPE